MAASGPPAATSRRVIIIEWLTSDDASYATGGYFTIDGGPTCL
jgi:hypothetical protein